LSSFRRTRYGPRYKGWRGGVDESSWVNTWVAVFKDAGIAGAVARTWLQGGAEKLCRTEWICGISPRETPEHLGTF